MQVEPTAVQRCFQSAFETWGRPAALRFDNGYPWAVPQVRVPSALALWLVGLGIRLIYGRPRQSTDNAVVERSHGVLANWVEPERCANPDALQQHLTQCVHIQRAVYPSCDGVARLTRYPELRQPRRRYAVADDEQLWDLQAVRDYVATFRFTRTIEKNGRMTLMTHAYAVGRAYARQQVTAYLDPTSGEWVVEDQRGEIIRRFVADQLNYSTIAHLAMRYRAG
jgi:hypothetical protein